MGMIRPIGGAAAAGTLTGATLASNVVASSLTSVGTLTGATVAGVVSCTGTGNYVKMPSMTVAQLPSAAVAGAGARALVTDANVPAFITNVLGGGSSVIPVYSDGTNWKGG